MPTRPGPGATQLPAAPHRRPCLLVCIASLAALGASPASGQNPSYTLRLLAGTKAHVIAAQLGPSVRVSVTVAQGQRRYPAESFGRMVGRTRPAAAINGAAFCTTSLKPIGDIVVDGRLVNRGLMGTALCLAKDGKASIHRVPWGQTQDWRGFETVLACGPTLVKHGTVDLDPSREHFVDPNMLGTASHSACGLSPDGRLYLVCVTSAVSVRKMALIMVELGCSDAMLLDGGSSTAMHYRGSTIVSPGRALTNLLVVYETQTPAAEADRHYSLGMRLKKSGDTAAAELQFRQVLALSPDHLKAHWTLAWVLAGRRQGAADEFRQVLRLSPTRAQQEEAQAALQRLGGEVTPPSPTTPATQ